MALLCRCRPLCSQRRRLFQSLKAIRSGDRHAQRAAGEKGGHSARFSLASIDCYQYQFSNQTDGRTDARKSDRANERTNTLTDGRPSVVCATRKGPLVELPMRRCFSHRLLSLRHARLRRIHSFLFRFADDTPIAHGAREICNPQQER